VNKRPKIIENYRNFEPPPKFRDTIDELVRYTPEEFLTGLQSIVLTNRAILNHDEKRQKTWSRNRKIRLAAALGYYTEAAKSAGASIVLYVDNLTDGSDNWVARLPLLRYLLAGDILYHEIGHHIHAAHRPVHKGKEDVAEYWSGKLLWRFVRKRYWYLSPAIYATAKTMKFVKRIRRTFSRTRD